MAVTKTQRTVRRAQKKASKVRDNPALIDSSYTGFFIASVFIWGLAFCTYFPPSVRLHAYILITLFSLLLYVFQYFLVQFYDAITILRMTVLYASFSSLLTILSALKGPIADGKVPVIDIIFIGSYVGFSGSGSSLITASLFTFYGTITLISAAITAGLLEAIYDGARRYLPRSVLRTLYRTDDRIDELSDTLSWKMFAVREWPGVLATILLLAVYFTVYIVFLIV